MKKSIVALMVIACIALGGITLVLGFSEDKKAPEIQFQDNEITFTQGDDYAGLLQGVTATDNRDGDVTKSLVVESVYPNDDGETATVVYVARDKTNNIGKANKVINYQPSKGETAETSVKGESATGQEEASLAQSTQDPQAAPTPEETTANNVPTPGEKDEEEKEAAEEEDLPAGSPKLKLTEDEVTVKKGESVNRIAFVESITDDKDAKESLFRQIQITGDDLDVNTAGTYVLTYYVVDSDGNRSNEADLTITVE